jgi:hypothetical protein
MERLDPDEGLGRRGTTCCHAWSGAAELSSILAPEGDSVRVMKTLALFGIGFRSPLQVRLRTRFRSIALFREVFFWRLKRELRKQSTLI